MYSFGIKIKRRERREVKQNKKEERKSSREKNYGRLRSGNDNDKEM